MLMSGLDSARTLGHYPTELALTLSLLLSLSLTAAISLMERARPWLRSGLQRRWAGQSAVFERLDEGLVLLGLGLAGVLGGATVFLQVVEGLRETPWLAQWDALFVETVHQTVTQGELAFFSAITPLAGRFPPFFLGFLVAGYLLGRRQKVLCAVWSVGLIGNGLLIEGLKRYFERQRPSFEQPLLVETNFSFPSGHSVNSIVLYGLLAYVCSRTLWQYKPLHRHVLIWAITFMGVLIGTSRLVLGVHYPTDVLAGWAVGTAWLAFLVLTAEVLRGRFGWRNGDS